jgi:hypothetical protein
MQSIAARPDGGGLSGISSVDQRERYYAYRHVAPYPAYVAFGIATEAVLQPGSVANFLTATERGLFHPQVSRGQSVELFGER